MTIFKIAYIKENIDGLYELEKILNKGDYIWSWYKENREIKFAVKEIPDKELEKFYKEIVKKGLVSSEEYYSLTEEDIDYIHFYI